MGRHLEQLRAEVLRQIAEGERANDVLAGICLQLEKIFQGCIVGVTMLDRTAKVFEHAVFPSLPRDYAAALQGIEVSDRPGSCALAVFDGRTVVCRDVATDPRFSDGWKALGLRHGLRAVISIPAVEPRGLTLGTLVITFDPACPPSRNARRQADEAAKLCGIVLRYRLNQLRNELLLGELQHRMRNLFNTIGAVVYATLRSHTDPQEFRKTFDGRLTALAKAHSLALNPGEAELRQLIKDTLAPYSIDHDIKIEGPRIALTQEAAVALSLATHELATNAAKYGALSADAGSIRVAWSIEEKPDGPQFLLRWYESGGPPVRRPSHHGYGHKTMTRSVASAFDAAVKLDYLAEGLQCRMTAPFSRRLGSPVN